MGLHELGRLYRTLPAYTRARQRACTLIERAFMQCERPYLSISGGKDSVAMLGLVEDVATRLQRSYVLWAHVSDASFPGTIETLEACRQRVNRRLFLDESPVSAFTVQRDSLRPFGKTGYFFEAIARFEKDYGPDLKFIGVRASESKRRAKACQVHGPFFPSSVTGFPLTVCYPLIDFSVEDVCATIVEADLPFHPIYTKKSPSGDPRDIRLGYVTARDLTHKGTVAFIKYNYPQLYNRLVTAFPEMSQYA